MKVYLVGGAVRDRLLGLPIKEKDWVVVGATEADMLKKGFRQVGKDFPVFLHPQTKEEYALARRERKIGAGYTGFDFDASPNVTLEEDLLRRDLTINAIAETPEGELVDPYEGKKDLTQKILRHVSPAFIEDPVRILRVARFAARFAALGFTVADETIVLMKQMVEQGEVNALVAERVFKELERALLEKHPETFFEVLAISEALPVLFPALQLDQNALRRATSLSPEPTVRFAALLQTNPVAVVEAVCNRYRIPSAYRELALLVAKQGALYQKATTLNANEISLLLQAVDAFRRPERFQHFLLACEAATGTASSTYLQACYAAAQQIDAKEWAGLVGKEIGEKIQQKRLEAIEKIIKNSPSA